MPGSLALSTRENGTFEWTEVMVQPVNGSFAISHRLDAALTPIPAGAIDVRLQFTPDQPGGSDDAVLPRTSASRDDSISKSRSCSTGSRR